LGASHRVDARGGGCEWRGRRRPSERRWLVGEAEEEDEDDVEMEVDIGRTWL
jgi:hypothetical protein